VRQLQLDSSHDFWKLSRKVSRRASAVGERLPLIWGILIPQYTTSFSDFAERRAREDFFAAAGVVRFGDRFT
jgi:hypothetical protein